MKFTIFTGCYNSAPFIRRVFDSIEQQTYRNFEWIIIDDCSKDNTAQLVQEFISAHQELDIKFLQNETNRGVAYGRWKAIEMASGDFFVSWDHDDIAKYGQLQRLCEVWVSHGKDNIGNIWSLCEDEQGKLVGNPFPKPVSVANYFDYYIDYIIDGQKPTVHKERFVCSRVEALRWVLKKYKTESILPDGRVPNGDDVWGMMALQYDTIFLNEVMRTYFIEPTRPSLSKGSRDKMAERVYLNKKIWLNYYLPKIPLRDIGLRSRLHFAFAFYGFLSGRGPGQMLADIKRTSSKIQVAALFLPASLLVKRMKGTNQ